MAAQGRPERLAVAWTAKFALTAVPTPGWDGDLAPVALRRPDCVRRGVRVVLKRTFAHQVGT